MRRVVRRAERKEEEEEEEDEKDVSHGIRVTFGRGRGMVEWRTVS